MSSFWDWLTFLWDSAVSFLGYEIVVLDVHFTLWEMALGFAIFSLIVYAIARVLD